VAERSSIADSLDDRYHCATWRSILPIPSHYEAGASVISRSQAIVSWSSFPSLEGTRLHSRRLGPRNGNSCRMTENVWLTKGSQTSTELTKLRVGSRDYELRWSKRHARPLQERELVDVTTGQVIFKLVGAHFNGKATARLFFPSQECVESQYRARNRSDATLSATDRAGSVLVSCRIAAPRFTNHERTYLDVVVAPNAVAAQRRR